MTETFISSRQLQGLEFSNLHENIIGFRITNLREEILRSGFAVDGQDLWGYTPLHWASARGRQDAVSQLIEFGADLNIANIFQQPPLYLAIKSGNVECAITLLRSGAKADFVTTDGWTSIMVALVFCEAHPSTIDLLDMLYELGVDINAKRASGFYALMDAVYRSRDVTIRWVLDHGGNYRMPIGNATILHYVGFFGNINTVEILRKAHWSGIDIHAKREGDGCTAMEELFSEDRVPAASNQLVASFTRLLSEIEARSKKTVDDEIGDEMAAKQVFVSPDSDDKVISAEKPNFDHLATDSDREDHIFWDTIESQTEELE